MGRNVVRHSLIPSANPTRLATNEDSRNNKVGHCIRPPPIDTSLLSYPHTNTSRNQTAINISFKFHGVDKVLFNRVNRHLIRFQPACLSAQEELMRSSLMAT